MALEKPPEELLRQVDRRPRTARDLVCVFDERDRGHPPGTLTKRSAITNGHSRDRPMRARKHAPRDREALGCGPMTCLRDSEVHRFLGGKLGGDEIDRVDTHLD